MDTLLVGRNYTHANLMLHTIDRYIKEYDLKDNAIIEFTIYDLAVNGLDYSYLNLGYGKQEKILRMIRRRKV